MRKLLFATALTFSAMTGCTKSEEASAAPAKDEQLAKLSLDEVEQGLAANKLKVVDSNGDGTRKKMGVVPGAILITDEESFAASELPADKSTKLVFYCANTSCHACHTAALRARSLGYTNVAIMPEGIAGWVKAGKKVQKT